MMKNVRFLLLVILVMSAIVIYVNRTHLNIAIVSMTRSHHHNHYDASGNLDNVSFGCPVVVAAVVVTESTTLEFNSTTESPGIIGDQEDKDGQVYYDWDQSTQGIILGSFFYSYFLFQIPSGMIAESFGGKHVIFVSLLGSGIGSLAVPLIANSGQHYWLICLVRCLVGVCQAGFFPASFGIACKWMPLSERSFAFAIIELGSNVGSVLTFYASGYIINQWGWQTLFYAASVSAFSMLILHFFCIHNEPQHHALMTDQELGIIRSSDLSVVQVNDGDLSGNQDKNSNSNRPKNNTTKDKKTKKKIPWIPMLTNVPVIAAITFKFSYIWMFSLFYLEMPKYLHEILHENIVDNGTTNAIINVLATMTLASTGFVSERMIIASCFGLNRTGIRKLFALFNGFGYALTVALIPSIGCHVISLKSLLYTSAFLQGFNAGSSIPIVSEMSHNFPSLLYSILNMVAMSTGFLVPAFVGWILDSHPEDQIRGWNVIFYVSSGILATATVFYLLCAKAERQEFDMIVDDDDGHDDANDDHEDEVRVERIEGSR